MNPGGEEFTPQINNATSAIPQQSYQQNTGTQQPLSQTLQPQSIPQQIPPINTELIPVENQEPQQQVPAMASSAQSPELEASTPITGKSRIESAWSLEGRALVKFSNKNILDGVERLILAG